MGNVSKRIKSQINQLKQKKVIHLRIINNLIFNITILCNSLYMTALSLIDRSIPCFMRRRTALSKNKASVAPLYPSRRVYDGL